MPKKYLLIIFILFFINPVFGENHRIYYSEGYNGAVSCGHPLAAQAAVKVLKEGGNAVDAAITAAFVLGVVDFTNSGIGGEGYALICSPNGRIIAIDGSTRRPTEKIQNEYKCTISLPAIPEMLLKMRRLYGTKTAKRLLQPAIDLCHYGFEISPYLSSIISDRISRIKDSNALMLIAPNNTPLKAGQILKQPKLELTLKRLAFDQGLSFYYGKDADKTISDMKSKGSFYTKYDFMKYKSKLCKPVKATYKYFEIFGNPLPSCSVVSIKLTLNLLATRQPLLYQTPDELLCQAGISRKILNEKYYNLSDFYDKPQDFLYFDSEMMPEQSIDANDTNTTHLCVWDKNNLVVSMTLTLGNHFGTGQLAPGGFFYANSLRTYSNSIVRYSDNYPVYAGSITSKSPVIVTKFGRPWLALGGAGADRIISNTGMVLARMLRGYKLSESVAAPRFYLEYNNRLIVEESEKSNEKYNSFLKELKQIYPQTSKREYLHDYFGLVSAIYRDDTDKEIEAVGDMHRDGYCLAY
ncbi:MAG: gamma-glutamyltransferase [Candidatus Riflebacteria bacterium]|nr:gamma-glutamyltransferase [Candidatus Riflebacteria bacterium]